MKKTISISHACSDYDTFIVDVNYQISTNEDRTMSIMCGIENLPPSTIPVWLRVKNFEVRARLHKGYYTMLYNDSDYEHNLATSLFIDTATTQIMKQEQMRKVI